MKTNTRRSIKRIICFVIMLSMLSQSSIQTYAWPWKATDAEQKATDMALEPETGTEPEETLTEESSVEPRILQEIEENRGEFSKEYLLSDNSRTVVVYPDQIHYENADGKLEEIDNSLVKMEEGYANGSNSYDVVITDNKDSQGEVIYKEDGYQIAWQMVELVEENAGEEETEEETMVEEGYTLTQQKDDFPEQKEEKEHSEQNSYKKENKRKKEKIHTPPNLEAEVSEEKPNVLPFLEEEDIHQIKQSKITFDGYEGGVSVEYQPASDGIKENIVLPSGQSGNEYVFRVRLTGLNARLNTGGEIEFYDEETDEVRYYFPAPFMIDNDGEISYAASYVPLDLEVEGESEPVTEEETEKEESEAESESVTIIEVETESESASEETAFEIELSGSETAETEEEVTIGESEETTEEVQTETTEEVQTETTAEETETESVTEAETEDISSEGNTEEIFETELNASEDGSFYIKIVLDEQWLEEASYPVTVDPVLKQARAKNLTDYGSVGSDGSKSDILYAGKKGSYIYRSFVRFELPQIEKQSIVSEAMLYLDGELNSSSTHYITASTVNEEWYNNAEEPTGKELSWENQPAAGDLLDYHLDAGKFNITKAVRKWMSGEQENYGIVFKAYDEEKTSRDVLALKNSASSPYLKITYRTAVGLESYWGTHATGAGTAGAGYINDYTGALTVINTDVVTAGNRFPMSIGHVYNSNDTEKKGGWRLNYDQTICIPLDTVDITTYPYVYTDEDGTEHYFKKGDVTYLENGASKTVKGSATITSAQDE